MTNEQDSWVSSVLITCVDIKFILKLILNQRYCQKKARQE